MEHQYQEVPGKFQNGGTFSSCNWAVLGLLSSGAALLLLILLLLLLVLVEEDGGERVVGEPIMALRCALRTDYLSCVWLGASGLGGIGLGTWGYAFS